MEIVIILKNMSVILLMAFMGYVLYKKGILEENINKKLSTLVVDLCNPALSIACIIEDKITATHQEILQAVGISIAIYGILILLGSILPKLLKIEKGEEKFYHMMTVYTNVGFIGLPLARAMLHGDAMLYVIIFNVLYSLFFYTHGYFFLGKRKEKAEKAAAEKKERRRFSLNLGLISGVATIIIVWFDLPIPEIIGNVCIYTGDANTFLAMSLLGASIAAAPLKQLLSNKKLYGFLGLRMLFIPIVAAFLLKFMKVDQNMVLAFTLMLSMPMASMPLMLAERNGEDTRILSQGIAISTAVSFATITLVLGLVYS